MFRQVLDPPVNPTCNLASQTLRCFERPEIRVLVAADHRVRETVRPQRVTYPEVCDVDVHFFSYG